MKFNRFSKLLALIVISQLVHNKTFAQSNPISNFFPEINILTSNGPAEGYFFMGSKGTTGVGASQYISIIDNYGTPVFFRKTNSATASMRLLNDGRIAYMHGVPRKLIFLDSMLEISEMLSVQGYKINPHDWDVSTTGNVILMGQSSRVVDMTQFVENGNPEAEALDLIVQEFDNNSNLLFTWNSAEHFEITDANENSPYVDFAEKQLDYVHANGICYDSDSSFLVSCRHMDEITKVDRRTGDIIWRLGGKKNQFQFTNDDIGFSHQHSIRSLENGNILLFDNGNLHIPQLSSAIEYKIDEQNKTATLINRYYRNPAVYSNHQGTTQRVFNGNTIINWGPYWPSFTEFHPDGTIAAEWDYTEHSFTPRIEKYKWQAKVFETNLDSIDFGNWESDTLIQSVWLKNNTINNLDINKVETRTGYFNVHNELPIVILPNDSVELKIWFSPESSEIGYFNDVITISSDSETQRIARQIKVTGHKEENIAPSATILTESTDVILSSSIQIKFTEPVKSEDGYELDFSSVDPFVVFKKNNSDGEDVPFNASISSDKTVITIYPETNLEKSSIYYLTLNGGLSDYSGNQLIPFETVISTVVTGISESFKSKSKIRIFPNPASSKVIIQSRLNYYSLKLYNSVGTLLRYNEFREREHNEIDVSELRNGVYLFVIEWDGEKEIKKIVIR
ncbi:MAG: aryl-sulfate sulfotransferase [Bacteroidetes bacterium]|nr:aryl-sulfate sulfotransferase [Bacteroidota bacterium]